ncbi:MAG: hypothetical protein ACLFVJ_02970 [Persicimonas sp.]
MKYALAKLVVALGAVLLAVASSGCQSMERMSRPDAHASIERPEDWPRERAEETHGVLFEIHHPEQPVRIRLRRLEPALMSQAHPIWAEMWLEASYDALGDVEAEPVQIDGRRATRLDANVTDNGDELLIDMLVVNAGADSFVLEAWGPRSAMEETAETRRRIVDSVEFAGATKPDRASEDDREPTYATADGWRLRLPAIDGAGLGATWQVEQISEGRVVLELPSQLIEAELFAERLPYPIDATRYAKIALDLDEAPSSDDPHDAVVRVDDDSHRVPMVHTYRFITRGGRAAQVVVSTPEALYDNNQALVDEVLEGLEADPENPSGSSGNSAE